nr:MAG TPA: hypothetical protein [Caudoviricetes sp.]
MVRLSVRVRPLYLTCILYRNRRGKTTVFCEQYVNHNGNFFILWTYSIHNYE